jgi:hypothetical protein
MLTPSRCTNKATWFYAQQHQTGPPTAASFHPFCFPSTPISIPVFSIYSPHSTLASLAPLHTPSPSPQRTSQARPKTKSFMACANAGVLANSFLAEYPRSIRSCWLWHFSHNASRASSAVSVVLFVHRGRDRQRQDNASRAVPAGRGREDSAPCQHYLHPGKLYSERQRERERERTGERERDWY